MKKSPDTKDIKSKRTLTPSVEPHGPKDRGDKKTLEEEALRHEREAVMHDEFKKYQRPD